MSVDKLSHLEKPTYIFTHLYLYSGQLNNLFSNHFESTFQLNYGSSRQNLIYTRDSGLIWWTGSQTSSAWSLPALEDLSEGQALTLSPEVRS